MDKGEILTLVWQTHQPKDVIYLIWYGNRQGADVDLVLVTPDGIAAPRYEPASGGLDLFQTTISEFNQGLTLADPALTEAVLTGRLLYGEAKEFFGLKKYLRRKPVGPAEIKYLKSKSAWQLQAAKEWLAYCQQHQEPKHLLFVLLCLSFALSFHLFACHYQTNGRHLVTFKFIQSQGDEMLAQVLEAFKRAKSGEVPDVGEVSRLGQAVAARIAR